MKYTSLGVFIF